MVMICRHVHVLCAGGAAGHPLHEGLHGSSDRHKRGAPLLLLLLLRLPTTCWLAERFSDTQACHPCSITVPRHLLCLGCCNLVSFQTCCKQVCLAHLCQLYRLWLLFLQLGGYTHACTNLCKQPVSSYSIIQHVLLPVLQVVKLGEGTYGEAFKSGGVVFKLVPMEGDNLINSWPQKGAGDLLGEAIIAITLSGLAEQADAAGEAVPMHNVYLTQMM
jgi:hypothetical protein